MIDMLKQIDKRAYFGFSIKYVVMIKLLVLINKQKMLFLRFLLILHISKIFHI